jgi:hypothetical protein
MGRRKLPHRVYINLRVSEEFHQFLYMKKADRREPLDRVADRIMGLYRLSDKSEMEETIEKQRRVIEFYYNKIKQLEAGKQTVLME